MTDFWPLSTLEGLQRATVDRLTQLRVRSVSCRPGVVLFAVRFSKFQSLRERLFNSFHIFGTQNTLFSAN